MFVLNFQIKDQGKPFYVAYIYREHSSELGNSIAAQRQKLQLLINQFEAAIEHQISGDQNEIHILGDINLDSLKWHLDNYNLKQLARMIINFCNVENFTQLITKITRTQYNRISGITETSCIDHFYTNRKFKCSDPSIIPFGDSDHDIICVTRLTKNPPIPSRTIKKRSYKNFDKKSFLEDLKQQNWSDVLNIFNLEESVEVFTIMFRNILNKHAPLIVFQERKNHAPWITEETKVMMKNRDKYKEEAKLLNEE